jgi:hypothetical protein
MFVFRKSPTQLSAVSERGRPQYPLHSRGATDAPVQTVGDPDARLREVSLIATPAFLFAWALFQSTFCRRD